MHALRLRLTLLYAGVLAGATGILLALSWWLLDRHLERTLPAGLTDGVMAQVAWIYVLATAGLVMVAAGAGWLLAGPLLERVQAAAERQRRFVANAGHELRTPLTVIRTEPDVTLSDPHASVQELRAMGRVIIDAADRTEELLDGLLVLATAEHGARTDEPVELAALTRRVAASLQRPAARAGVRFDVDAEPAWVRGDSALLERLVANLLENVIHHGAGGSERRASIRVRDGAAALVEVANGGVVIAPAALARLGEPFQRLDRSRTDHGAGLGLSIVRAVAEAHGGGLELRAPAGGGLLARVTLPGGAVLG
jgi:signal transduction histidine kinase